MPSKNTMISKPMPWPQVPVRNEDRTNAAVVIVGAGLGGICTAIELIRNYDCHNFIILDKGNNFGGTWLDNKYPGCCCDIWSILYSFSFEQNPHWSREYPGQEELLDYVVSIAQKWDLYKYVRFNSSVTAATWDDTTQQWKIDVAVLGDKEREYADKYIIASDFLVSAIGQLNSPNIPNIPGRESFQGKAMHSARWDWNYNIRDKRVGIIGSGATSIQVVPEIAPLVSHLTVYQRTPGWVVTRADREIPKWRKKLFQYVPFVQSRFRAAHMDEREITHDVIKNSDDSRLAKMEQEDCLAKINAAFPSESEHDQRMRKALTPHYTIGCKRIMPSDDWYPTLARENVTLETRPIARIDENGPTVCDEDSSHEEHVLPSHEKLDLLIWATGFQTLKFLHPMRVTGAQGRHLEDIWQNGPHALYGVSVPDLPNFGMLYGPNTNLGHNSIVLILEAQAKYISGLAGAVLESRSSIHNAPNTNPVDVAAQGQDPEKLLTLILKTSRVKSYEHEMQSRLKTTAWADPNCTSWYKDPASGKITNNWPGDCREYMDRLSAIQWDEYEGGNKVVAMRSGKQGTAVGRVREETHVTGNTAMAFGVVSAIAAFGVAWGRWGRGFSLVR